MSILKSLITIFSSKETPKEVSLDEVYEKAKFFLSPQISCVEQFYGNKFTNENKISAIGLSSIAYSIAIAEEISNHRIANDKRMECLLEIYGDEYEDLFVYLFSVMGNDQNRFTAQIQDSRQLAKQDARNGLLNCSNYLVTHAQGLMAFGGDLELVYKDIIAFVKSRSNT